MAKIIFTIFFLFAAILSFASAGHPIIGPTCVDDTWLDPTVSAPCGTFVCPDGWTIENYGGNRCCCDPDDGDGGH